MGVCCWSSLTREFELLRWKLVTGNSLKQWRQRIVFLGTADLQP